VFHVAWLPVHLTTEAHCDTGPGHSHAQAQADHHGHSHDEADESQSSGDADHHHFTGDHEGNYFAKRHLLIASPAILRTILFEWLNPPTSQRLNTPRDEYPPPPADFSPPTGPRAPPLA
jgi:ABC-type Zn2+ transport system substrate-binding protein/surface adhesin